MNAKEINIKHDIINVITIMCIDKRHKQYIKLTYGNKNLWLIISLGKYNFIIKFIPIPIILLGGEGGCPVYRKL